MNTHKEKYGIVRKIYETPDNSMKNNAKTTMNDEKPIKNNDE